MFIDPLGYARERYRHAASVAADDALLDLIGPLDDTHVLLIGPGGLEMMCNLIDAGCTSVEKIGLGQRHRGDFAEIVIVPAIDSFTVLHEAVAQARRVMRPLNTLVLRFTADDPAALVREARSLLAAQGFSAIRTYHLDRTVLTAELPLCGGMAGL